MISWYNGPIKKTYGKIHTREITHIHFQSGKIHTWEKTTTGKCKRENTHTEKQTHGKKHIESYFFVAVATESKNCLHNSKNCLSP